MKKNILLFVFALLSTLTANAYDAQIDGIYYNLNADTKQATVTSGDTQYTGSVTIPTTVTYNDVTYSVTSIRNAFGGCTGLTSVEIPNSVTFIGDWLFKDCSGLTNVTIPNSVTTIKDGAFCGCSGLTSIEIPNSVTTIGWGAFEFCSGLTSITIPNSVTSIGGSAFDSCTGLTSVTIGSSVTEIGSSIFYDCYVEKDKFINNSSLDAEANNYWGLSLLDSRENGICIRNSVFVKYVGSESSISIPNSVTSIGERAFYYCTGLTSITIPNSVTSIGQYAFAGCSSLTSVKIPNSVTSIGSFAFSDCPGLTSVTIPNSVTSIGYSAFYVCSGLTSLTIGNSVSEIGVYAFSGCSDLNSISVENGNKKYDSRDNCNAIIETSTNSMILGCKNTIIPNSVTSIGENAFRSCSGLTKVTIPNSVTTIEKNAFYCCDSLTSLTIPNSVTSIGHYAFDGCSGLISVTCEATYVPSTGKNVFSSPQSNVTLYVPASALETYKTTVPWSGFGNIVAIGDEPTLRGDVNGDGIVNGTDIQAIINAIVEGEYDEKADVNEDDVVNGTDIQEVINIIVNAD